MKNILYMASVALAAMAIYSCDEDTMNIGQSLTSETDKLSLADTVYSVPTRTVAADSVFTLSSNCYFGRVIDPETGSEVKSEFTTQFHVLENMYISPDEKIVGRYDGKAAADSCDLIIYLDQPFNAKDSLTAIKMNIYELATPIAEGQRFYSNYSPKELGMLNPAGLFRKEMFTYRNLTYTDSIRATSSFLNNIRVTLNEPFTDGDGNTYNNYGTYLMQQYYAHPQYFSNSYAFTHNVCPGLFFEITDGLGFHARVSNIGLRTFYRVKGDTTVVNAALTLAGTQEVLQTTLVTNDKGAIDRLKQETGHTYLKTPAGLFTEVTLPVDDIKLGHENDSLLGARITFQRLNNESADERMFGIPQTLLMVKADSLSNFFENTMTIDSRTTFSTTYDVVNSSKAYQNVYSFENISNLITEMWNKKQEGLRTNPNWVAEHPRWNVVLLVPITVTSSAIEHDMSLTSTRLVGGPDNPDAVKISVVYGKFKEK